MCDYKTLPRPGATEYWDDHAKATFSYDPQKRVLNSYDSPLSAYEKSKYAWQMGLRGVIVWESSGDYPFDDNRSVLKALSENLKRQPA